LDEGEYYSVYSAIRWTAPVTIAANQEVTVDIALGDSLQSIDTWVAQGTDILYENIGTTLAQSEQLSTSISAGDVIDVLIKRNIAADGYHNVLPTIGFTVTEVPEPLTIGLLSLGGVALLRRRR